MPYCLVGGVVTAKPKVDHFPKSGKPRAEVTIRVDSQVGELYRIVGFDDMVDEIEVLQPNDCISVQGSIELEMSKANGGPAVVTGFHVIAKQVVALASVMFSAENTGVRFVMMASGSRDRLYRFPAADREAGRSLRHRRACRAARDSRYPATFQPRVLSRHDSVHRQPSSGIFQAYRKLSRKALKGKGF